jgi:hypothetical protein
LPPARTLASPSSVQHAGLAGSADQDVGGYDHIGAAHDLGNLEPDFRRYVGDDGFALQQGITGGRPASSRNRRDARDGNFGRQPDGGPDQEIIASRKGLQDFGNGGLKPTRDQFACPLEDEIQIKARQGELTELRERVLLFRLPLVACPWRERPPERAVLCVPVRL